MHYIILEDQEFYKRVYNFYWKLLAPGCVVDLYLSEIGLKLSLLLILGGGGSHTSANFLRETSAGRSFPARERHDYVPLGGSEHPRAVDE